MICVAIITSGGIGQRMGSSIPKQFLDLNGLPVLARTLAVFDRHPLIERIIVTVPKEHEDTCKSTVLDAVSWLKTIEMIRGGKTRQQSVFNGLQKVGRADFVAIHDGVRPLVTPEIITETIEAARLFGAAVAGIRIAETLKRQSNHQLETLSTSGLWLAHTPQIFESNLIRRAHVQAITDGFTGTDDSVLVERLGHPVVMVEDSKFNIKITLPEDLEAARVLFPKFSDKG